MSGPGGRGASAGPPTVFFLSDYGLADEFVGVVHAVVHRVAPAVRVVDLTHGVAPFDVRAGSEALRRAVPHLGAGVVLAVVDPGVGGARRGVAVESAGDGARWLVGPDNGLLVDAAELAGPLSSAWTLRRPVGAPATFDGRDVFAPAAALLATGGDPVVAGDPLDPAELVRLGRPLVELAGPGDVRAEVVWVDRYGNVQLAAAAADAGLDPEAAGPATTGAATAGAVRGTAIVRVERRDATGETRTGATAAARRVRTFADLAPGELGVLADANGRVALVVREGSAAQAIGARQGDVVALAW